jgi:hypothetical protein
MCGGVCVVCVCGVCVCVCVCWGGVVSGSPPEWAIVSAILGVSGTTLIYLIM